MASETSNFDYLTLKNEGNALYSARDFLGAVQKYSKALIFCTDNNTDRTILLKNRAAAYLNLQEYQKVIEDTTAAQLRQYWESLGEVTPDLFKAFNLIPEFLSIELKRIFNDKAIPFQK